MLDADVVVRAVDGERRVNSCRYRRRRRASVLHVSPYREGVGVAGSLAPLEVPARTLRQ